MNKQKYLIFSIIIFSLLIISIESLPSASGTLATGGTITYSGDYTIHTFTSSGTFTVTNAGDVEYLVVAGGGGGGNGGAPPPSNEAGGGGAGGYRTGTVHAVTVQSYTITVGAKGASSTGNGGDSIFDTITSTGGGVGAVANGGSPDSSVGGSGGGGADTGSSSGFTSGASGNTPSTSPSQGNAGGDGTANVGGGGGGSGGAGTSVWDGGGGDGTSNSITGSAVTYAEGGDVGDGSLKTTAGSGGRGGNAQSKAPTDGKDGIIIIRYIEVPNYTVDLLDVYESSSTTLGSGTAICLDVDLENASSCGTGLNRGSTYRFEVEVDNIGDIAGSPASFDFDSVVASGDVLGTIIASGISNSGCSTNTNWNESIASTDARATGGTTCSISTSGSVEYWMIITLDNDADDGTGTFTITDGDVSDTSTVTTFTVLYDTILTAHVFENDGTTELTSGNILQQNSTTSQIFSLNNTGHAVMNGLHKSTNQNFTIYDSDNYILNRTINFSPITDETKTFDLDIFRVSCGSGNDVIIKVNETNAHYKTTHSTPECSEQTITWNSTFTALGNFASITSNFTSTLLATVLDLTNFNLNPSSFTVNGNTISTTYLEPDATSLPFNVTDGASSTFLEFSLILGNTTESSGDSSGSGSSGSSGSSGATTGIINIDLLSDIINLSFLSSENNMGLGETQTFDFDLIWDYEASPTLKITKIEVDYTNLDDISVTLQEVNGERITVLNPLTLSEPTSTEPKANNIRYTVETPQTECGDPNQPAQTSQCANNEKYTIPFKLTIVTETGKVYVKEVDTTINVGEIVFDVSTLTTLGIAVAVITGMGLMIKKKSKSKRKAVQKSQSKR